MPAAMALRAEESGVKRASTDPMTLLCSASWREHSFHSAQFSQRRSAQGLQICLTELGRLLTGLVFSVGLILVIIGGAELFTGNNIIVMAWASGKVKSRALLLNWVLAFIGNFAGAFADRRADVLHHAIHVWRRRGRTGRTEHGTCESVTGFCSGADARYHV